MTDKYGLSVEPKAAEVNLADPQRCFLIAEVAQAHDGSLGFAHSYIDAAAKAGADAIKFQTHIAAEESTAREPWRVRFSTQDESRFDYWRRMEFSRSQWGELAAHAAEVGLVFLSSAFSLKAVEWLDALDMPAWKVASGELTNRPLIEAMAATGKPVWLSSGMSDFAELERAAQWVKGKGAPLSIFQCTSSYPTPPEKVGLNVMDELREAFSCPVGLSDHSGSVFPSLTAAARGAQLLEVHVTFSHAMFGPDVPASLTFEQFGTLAEGLRWVDSMNRNPVDKVAAAADFSRMRSLFNKSIVVRSALPAGTVLTADMLALKKPGDGLPPERLDSVVGCTLIRDLAADDAITDEVIR